MWLNIGYNLQPSELCAAQLVCKNWYTSIYSLDTTVWKFHCNRIWKGKQNHPLEKWVNFSQISISNQQAAVINSSTADRVTLEQVHQLNEMIERHAESSRCLFEEIRLLQSQLDETETLAHATSSVVRYYELVHEWHGVRSEMAQAVIRRRRILCSNMWTSSRQQLIRIAAPISRAIITEWITQSELELAGLDDGEFEREEVLKSLITSNLNHQPSDFVCDYETRVAAEGRLLSWKESLAASVLDSTRPFITSQVNLIN